MGGHATVVDQILESNKLNCFSQSFVHGGFQSQTISDGFWIERRWLWVSLAAATFDEDLNPLLG